MPEATVAAIIINNINGVDHVLLTLRDHHPFNEFWCIPGGHIEKGETAMDAIKREIKEETNLDFSGQFYNYFEEFIPENEVNNIVLVFFGSGGGILPNRTQEVSDFKWVPFSESIKMNLAFRHNKILSDYFNRKLKNMNLKEKEIEILAEDIKNNINQTIEIVKFSVAAAAMIIAYSISKTESGFLSALGCLLPIPILMVAINMIFNRRQNVMEKATFLRIFGGPSFVYELFLRKLRDERCYKRSSFATDVFSVLKTMILISVISSFIITIFAAATYKKSFSEYFRAISQFDHYAISIAIMFFGLVIVFVLIIRYLARKSKVKCDVVMGPIIDTKCTGYEEKTSELWIKIHKDLNIIDPGRIPH